MLLRGIARRLMRDPLTLQGKNAALREAGAIVPDSFEAFETAIKETYERLVKEGVIVPQADVPAPSVPMDLEAAKKQGKVGRGLPCVKALGSWPGLCRGFGVMSCPVLGFWIIMACPVSGSRIMACPVSGSWNHGLPCVRVLDHGLPYVGVLDHGLPCLGVLDHGLPCVGVLDHGLPCLGVLYS
jgi:hypothetical protein